MKENRKEIYKTGDKITVGKKEFTFHSSAHGIAQFVSDDGTVQYKRNER